MSTHSLICVQISPKVIQSIYCHSDGYPSWVGRILNDHYDEKKVTRLMKGGDLSMLEKEIGKKHAFGLGERPKDQCTFYRRDRNEKNVDSVLTPSKKFGAWIKKEMWDAAYIYLFTDNVWLVAKNHRDGILVYEPVTTVLLREKLDKLNQLHQEITDGEHRELIGA